MGVRVASGCLNWSPSSNYWPSSSSPQTLASAFSSPSTRRRRLTNVSVVFRYHRPAIFGTKLNRSRSIVSTTQKSAKHIVCASLDAQFSDEEFCRELQELALAFNLSDDDEIEINTTDGDTVPESETKNPDPFVSSEMKPPEWTGDMIPASIERKANSVELPFSLRIIQRKKQWQEGIREAGESAYCSVKKAFSSMVFIIRELQSYTLQMREALFYEDLQEVLVRVQKEMNASFVWLFQQVFSHTPTLMVYVMILLANYSVHAMSNNVAFALAQPRATVQSILSNENRKPAKIDSTSIKPFRDISTGKSTSIGGINGGGKSRPIASGTGGEEGFDGAVSHHRKVIPDGNSSSSTINPSVSGQVTLEEEPGLWELIVQEAINMQDLIKNGVLDHQTMQRFVSPVTVQVMEEEDALESHLRTGLLYQMGLSEEPENPLLLANYAQFLYIIAQDYDRAEEYFKRASKAEPKDAEALSKFANFLWKVRKDLRAAEQTLLEAITVDPINPFYAATYANFLWANGPDDSCSPFDSPETANS